MPNSPRGRRRQRPPPPDFPLSEACLRVAALLYSLAVLLILGLVVRALWRWFA